MKKRNVLLSSVLGLGLLASCGSSGASSASSSSITPASLGDSSSEETPSDLPSAPSGSLSNDGANFVFTNGSFRLEFIKGDANYSLSLLDGTKVCYSQATPAKLRVRSTSSGLLETFDENTYSAAYSSITSASYGYEASASITTSQGSEFALLDRYYIPTGSSAFALSRKVSVTKQAGTDAGFESSFELSNAFKSGDYSAFNYFIPSILYKDTQEMRSGSIASNLDLIGKVLVKETRTGLPMSMAWNTSEKEGVSLVHLSPEIECGSEVGGGASGAIGEDYLYGSVGLTITPLVGVDFHFPANEGPNTYDCGQGWARRYNPVTAGFSHHYTVGILPTNESTYNDAMVSSYKSALNLMNPSIPNIGMEKIYDQNMTLFKSEYRVYGSNNNYGGEPWSLTLPNATVDQGYSSQFGFVGQQAPVGYQLYRYGIEKKDSSTKANGERSLNFWSSTVIQSTYFPTVWWDPSDNASGGTKRDYPAFLRCMVDGAEGLLDGFRMASANGESKSQWYNAVVKFADNLVAKQNTDGSFYRAYNNDGSVCTDTSNSAFQGTSELNTPIAVRFLVKMYELTKKDTYKDAAIKAAEYSYTNLYEALGKYVGGTPDNPNTVDKEAAVYALYCFDSAYTLTGEAKYLKAAEHAAVCSLSWVYVYDFAVPSSATTSTINTFAKGGVMGFSFIATGHSSADNYAAYTYFALYKLYLETEDVFFKTAALLIENCTKLCTDYDGRMGFKYAAMMPEATKVADFDFASVGTWLPWSGIANIEPIIDFKTAFGSYDIESLSLSLDEQKTRLASYGVGGTPITL